jgi:hypothetical protein
MKSKKILTLALALIMCLTMIPLTSTAADDLGYYSWAGAWKTNWGDMVLTQNGSTVTGTYTHDSGKIAGTVSGNTLTGTWSEAPTYQPNQDAGDIRFEMSADGLSFSGEWRYGSSGDWRKWDGSNRDAAVILPPTQKPTTSGTPWSNANNWALPELETANGYGLIPAILNGKDFTQSITRGEFAELVVQMVETLIGEPLDAAPSGTFTDANSLAIRKAYGNGIINGFGDGIFGPDLAITREDLATMVGRILPDAYTEGGAGNGELFIDEAEISDYAFLYVKVMAHFGIMRGTDNYCNPKKNCPREQAIAIVLRSFESVLLTIANGELTPVTPTPTPVTPTPTPTPTPSSGNIDQKLVGKWTHSSSGYWYGTSNWYAEIERYEFHSDGTFSYYNEINDQSKGAKNGIKYEKGVFSVSGGELRLTSIESKWDASDNNTVSTGWATSQSRTETYKLEEWYDGTYLLTIGNRAFHQGD